MPGTCEGEPWWLGQRGVDVLDVGRVHVDMWVAGQQDQGGSGRRAAAVGAVQLLPLLRRSRPGRHVRTCDLWL
jgi:hypothetical protein